MIVTYEGMKCTLIENYFCEGDGPYIKIIESKDIDKAYKKGFECMGYPTEIMKKITQDEYQVFVKGDR
mgnify:CR=1 FL=1